MSHDVLQAVLERLSGRRPYAPNVVLGELAVIACRTRILRVRFDGSVRRLVAEDGERELTVPAEPSHFRHLLARVAMLAVGPSGLYGFEPGHVALAAAGDLRAQGMTVDISRRGPADHVARGTHPAGVTYLTRAFGYEHGDAFVVVSVSLMNGSTALESVVMGAHGRE